MSHVGISISAIAQAVFAAVNVGITAAVIAEITV